MKMKSQTQCVIVLTVLPSYQLEDKRPFEIQAHLQLCALCNLLENMTSMQLTKHLLVG